MVLESVVADLLNRFLGDYVENLNKSQLKLGIWGGNVALDNLQITENALSELDVPFKVKAGQIDKLTLKIPWKNLYGEAVVATLEGLYLLVVPGASIKYDAEKEEKSLQDIKQRELSRIEEALKKAAEKDKPKEAKKDTFLEKLATQVIKNVQVKITDIHIKYEDDVTDPERPLSFGVTLGEFSLLLVKLDSLSAYWNVGCCMSYHGSREHILDQLKSEILTSRNIPPNHQYIFQPISASAKLYMNPCAESELKTPKLDGNIEVQNIAIELTKPQYLSMIDFLESLDYMFRNAPYRKYKPCLPLHTNCRQWQLLKSYKIAYKNKLTQTKVSEEIQKQIQDLEKSLDVFNIILVRQQAQVEIIHSGQKLRKKSAESGEKRGWFSGFWGKKDSKKIDEDSLIPETIDDLMTPEEKDKLFTAIGYSESTYNLALPKQYVAHILTLKLVSTSITIRENRNVPEILRIQIIGLGTQVSQRPGAQALKIEAKLEHWYVTGLRQQDIVPSLVASIGDTSSSLLKIEFETNPENSPADQTLIVQSQPVEVIYDAKTINAVVEFFQSNKGLDLEQITSATLMKLEEIKERTATGLTHIIETRKVLDLRINLKPSYLIIPQTGFHYKKSNLLILDFGTFQLNSKDQGTQKTTNSSLEEIIDKAYDKFDVEIKSVQLLFAKAEENWKKCRFQHPSTMHILQPMDIHVELAKAMVEKDIRMARYVSVSFVLEINKESDDEYFDAEDGESQTARTVKASELKKASEVPNEELVNLLLKFEIKEVILELTKQQKEEETVLVFNVIQLGTEATMRTFDLTAVSYLRKISLDYHEIKGSKKKPLHLISSSDKPGLDLLKVEYIKVDKNGPSFQTTFEKTEQTIKVAFSSLNLLLQTQALLSSLNYLTTIIPSDGENTGVVKEVQTTTEKQKNSTLQKAVVSSRDSDIIGFRLFAKLNAFCVTVCDEKSNIAEIKIQGLDSSLSLQSKKQSLFARLENIIVTDVDPKTVHKKSFLNNFQVAKEALSAATAQAAEKAATSVKDLAQRSFRVSVNIDLKAPVIVIPQSSVSTNAVVVDLGLIRVHNQFSMVSGEDTTSPPVIDKMEVQLTKLKLSRILAENLGETPEDLDKGQPRIQEIGEMKACREVAVTQDAHTTQDASPARVEETRSIDIINVLLNFEIKEVVVTLMKKAEKKGTPLHELKILHLGMEAKVKAHDITAEAYLRKISMQCFDFPDSKGEPLYIVNSSNVSDGTLLKMLFIKVSFSSLDLVLHLEALLSLMDFLSSAVPSSDSSYSEKESELKPLVGESKSLAIKAVPSTSEGDVFDMKITAELNAFNIFVCDQKSKIADIKIHGMDASISVKPKQTDVFARLENIVVMNVDSLSIHKKAVSILGDEVFRFQMTLYPDATAGEAYGDMSKVDGKLSLKVGCIQIVYVHKFFMSLLSFLNNFQTAKEALSSATVQAAEKAASSVKDLAQKSFRLLMDIDLKAPVITIPQSSVSPNAVIADLGLIRVENKFSLVPVEHYSLPPVADKMSIQLTQLQLSRMIDKKNDQDSNSSMIDISYRQDKNGSQIDAVLDKLYVCASVEFLMTVADFFIKAMPQSPENITKEIQIPSRQTAVGRVKMEKDDSVRPNMTLKAMITDPEVVFVANLTRADAPALTASFQCNLSLSTSKLEQMMEASVRDLKVLACPFLRERRGKSITTISPIILNTVMTILAAMTPKAKEDESKDTTKEMDNLWGIKSITDYNSWFLGVDTATEVTENFRDFEHPPIEENCVVAVESVQVTLECGLGHRTVPLLLAESKFSGNIKNWTSLMAAAADMTLEVKKNPIQDKSLMPGDDFIPESQMAVHISSEATMNITISKSCLNVFNNLAKGFSEGAASTFDYSLKDRAPFTVKNALGVPIKVQSNSNLRLMGSLEKSDIYDVDAGQHLELEYASLEPSRQGKLSILSRQESSFFTLTFVPHGYTEVGSVPVARPGRRLYNVRNPGASRSDSVLVQIDATEGNKVITLRSPLQIKNHFSIAFIIYKFVKNVKLLERIGIARPEEEFHVPLDSYRCQLYIQPAGNSLEQQYTQSTTYISWKEELHRSTEVRCVLQCPSVEVNFLPLIVNTVALPDELSYIGAHGEDWDPAYVIHLYPPLTLRNLLPYSLRYLLEGTAETHELAEGSAADVLHSRISGEIMELVLVKYLGKNWNGHFRICDTLPEFFLVCFSSDTAEMMTVDLSVHVRRIGCRMELSVFSPYWLINKTSRVLQYCSEEIHVKHPADFRDIVLFSFKKKNIFSKNKVGVSIKMSSFNLSRIVTLTPFCTIANKSSLELEVGEIASDGSIPTNKWHYVASSECIPFWPENLSGKLCVRVVGYERSSKPFFYNRQDNGTLLSLEDLDECGQFPYDANIQIHWVSFLDGRQRVLLFTDDVALVSKALQAEEMEQADHEVSLSLHSLGLSLVNNENKQEVSYVGITSSGVVWEMKPKQKWKPFSQKQIMSLEQSYQKHLTSQDRGWIKLDSNFEVNFDKVPMEMRLPIRCPIKRDFLSGIQVEFKQSPHQRSLRARLYWLQVDNQLPGTMFPVVFNPVAPPKSIALDSEPKPFIDVSVITRFNEYSQVLQFKLAYYEIRYQFYKRDQLMWSVVRHYSEQFLKQMYVLVLGLDVLGNPFGLIRGLSEGVEALFYEPFQGAVQGPEEFAEGLVIGVRSLFGHTVGGAAGVVSRITGSVGKGLAAITMDKEYQQKRREEMGRQPKDFGDSLARGGKGLLRGVFGGVAGIITKPVEGAKKEGAAGFFKGIGKGLVGAVARPTGGIIDMASSTFQGIQRVAESTEEVSSLRPPRLIHEDGIIRPYDRQESEGSDLLENHIKKLEGETYQFHCPVPGNKKAVFMITNRRVLFVKEVEILGHMSVDWQCLFEDFVCPPEVSENLLKISVKEQGLFHKKDSANLGCLRKIYLKDSITAKRAFDAIESAQSSRYQQKLMKQPSLRLHRPQVPS
ncbi:vacuolar protein sorting 13A [Cricetulus griseus]